MKILALEFSTDHRSAAVLEGESTIAPRILSQASVEKGRNTRPLALVEDALTAAGIDRHEVGRLAVGLGPGSYTGIRMAIALAQGWQLARPVSIIGVSSLECLAFQALEAGFKGVLHLCVDAQQGAFYILSYDLTSRSPSVTKPLCIVKREALQALSAAGETLAGPGLSQILPGGLNLLPEATTVGIIAAGRADPDPVSELEPICLRSTAFVKAPPPRFVP